MLPLFFRFRCPPPSHPRHLRRSVSFCLNALNTWLQDFACPCSSKPLLGELIPVIFLFLSCDRVHFPRSCSSPFRSLLDLLVHHIFPFDRSVSSVPRSSVKKQGFKRFLPISFFRGPEMHPDSSNDAWFFAQTFCCVEVPCPPFQNPDF